jgi:hypothetical protein
MTIEPHTNAFISTRIQGEFIVLRFTCTITEDWIERTLSPDEAREIANQLINNARSIDSMIELSKEQTNA